ncbi:nuclear transport factor 2 family protein [Nocardia elegans]|uniref:nuclear transport factor 2 family protein n=1 Tax=Nocardia elegans TaxID=300029 RepID=UPI0018956213|nr:nuclear transport factor 2 family protein [Nocardia elegans]MBF6451121.1 nuclear transport factor 2 family protein [Nocardia elegans]
MNESARLAELERRLRDVEDQLAITRLLASYGPLVDSGDAEATAALWTEDGEYDVPGAHMRSQEAIRSMVLSDAHRKLIETGSTHFIGPAQIEVEGDRAIAVCESILVLRAEDSYRILMSGSHRITLVRTDGEWKIRHRITRELNGRREARELLRIEPSSGW